MVFDELRLSVGFVGVRSCGTFETTFSNKMLNFWIIILYVCVSIDDGRIAWMIYSSYLIIRVFSLLVRLIWHRSLFA